MESSKLVIVFCDFLDWKNIWLGLDLFFFSLRRAKETGCDLMPLQADLNVGCVEH